MRTTQGWSGANLGAAHRLVNELARAVPLRDAPPAPMAPDMSQARRELRGYVATGGDWRPVRAADAIAGQPDFFTGKITPAHR